MRTLLILAGSVLVVLSGCAQWTGHRPGRTVSLPSREPGASATGARSRRLRSELGHQPAVAAGVAIDNQQSAIDESADEPLFEGPALPGAGPQIQLGDPSESAQSFKPAPEASPDAAGPADPNRPSLPWAPSFYSTQRRAVQGLRSGSGAHSTLVVGSLHGDEPLAVSLVERLAEYAGVCPDCFRGRTVVFLRTPNPDGLAAGTRTNCRGVDLNRNFPTFNFRANRQLRTGPSRGSEVETRGLLRLLYDFRPQRVVHLKTTTDGTGWVLYNRRATPIAQRFRGSTDLRLQLLTHNAIAGSLESYVADVLGLEMITVAVPAGSDAEGLWNEYADVLLTAIGATGGASRLSGSRTRPRTAGQASRGTHRGKTLSSESDWGPIPAKGYFELPPPPEEI